MNLRGCQPVAEVRLGRPVLSPRASAEERGQSDGDQNADDQNDHHQLDQGEALLVTTPIDEALDHGDSSFRFSTHPSDA
jgi:hypothetical protein